MNKITLIGRTTDDITLKSTQAGHTVASFTLAVKRPFKKDTTDFFNVIAWNKQAEILSQYVRKGNEVAINGHLESRTYEKDGQKRYITEVIVEQVYLIGGNSKQEAQAPSIQPDEDLSGFEGMPVIADSDLPF